jgi:hypothetical protein
MQPAKPRFLPAEDEVMSAEIAGGRLAQAISAR